MKRLVTDEDLTADPSLATIGVKVGDEYEFEETPADEARIPKFDPFTGAPLAPGDEAGDKPADEPAPEEEAEPAADESEKAPEAAPAESAPADLPAESESPAEESPEADAKDDQPGEESAPSPISYADILERGLLLNKVEAANLHPGISQIAQWGDLVERQEFKPAE